MPFSGRELSARMLLYGLNQLGRLVATPFQLVASGSFSPRAATMVQQIRTRRPSTYVEKIRYKMARDRRPLLALFADKVAVRGYVEAHTGPSRLSRIYSVASRFQDLDWQAVPEEYVLKVNHGCKGLIVVTRNAKTDSRLPPLDAKKPWRLHIVHPSALDRTLMKEWVDHWLTLSYNWRRWKYLEWPYSQISRKVFIEEFLGAGLLLARNIKVICFHGQVASLILTTVRADGTEVADGRFSAWELDGLSALSKISLAELAHVVTDSAELARETDFVRVDWVISPRGPIFGEMTNFPAAGGLPAGPSLTSTAEEVNELYSSLWKVPLSYDELPSGDYNS
ncbi:unannotated protein [freshwater metagenome]|uniref:Unannotated protein n=1 Tax=freshwater metagenome TaxID=449393 RepID=A0A6J6EWA0_9ZZZZ|nr:hypothetical protein [Actinomycetota bacterium]